MKRSLSIALLILEFIICAAVGILIVYVAKGNRPPTESIDDSVAMANLEPIGDESGSSALTAAAHPETTALNDRVDGQGPDSQIGEASSAPIINASADSLSITSVSSPRFSLRSRGFAVTVTTSSATGNDLTYMVLNENEDKNNPVKTSSRSTISGIPATRSGIYYVIVSDNNTGMMSKPWRIDGCTVAALQEALPTRVTKEELENKFNTGDYQSAFSSEWLASNTTGRVRLSFTGYKDEERDCLPRDFADICTHINTTAWRAVQVTDISYNDYNQISAITIRAIY